MKGAVIGDVVGSSYEFHNTKTKNAKLFREGKTDYTDDTVMSCAIMEVLLDKTPRTDAQMVEAFAQSMRKWGKNYPGRGYGSRFAMWLLTDDPKPYYSCGNGSAMRVSPVAMVAGSLQEAEHLAMLTALPTHNHPDGIAGAQATAGAIFLALHGADKASIKAYVQKYYPLDFTLDEIRPTYHFGHREGLNVGTVPYAVESFLESTGFEDCIRNIVSIGGDTDTLGAIGGPIAEAYYGLADKLWSKTQSYLPKEIRYTVLRFYRDYKLNSQLCGAAQKKKLPAAAPDAEVRISEANRLRLQYMSVLRNPGKMTPDELLDWMTDNYFREHPEDGTPNAKHAEELLANKD